jgi:hypothetical protein
MLLRYYDGIDVNLRRYNYIFCVIFWYKSRTVAGRWTGTGT